MLQLCMIKCTCVVEGGGVVSGERGSKEREGHCDREQQSLMTQSVK